MAFREVSEMGRHKIWAVEIECGVCGKMFLKEFSNQKYCCGEHSDIARRAKASKFGRDLLERSPAEAQAYYERGE